MRSFKIATLLVTVAAAGFGSAAGAASFDAVADFGNPVFSYGGGTPGAGFVASINFQADNCVGAAGLACYNTPGADYTFPAIGKNVSNSDPLVFYTNVLPKTQLFLQTNPGSDAIVRFIAPTAGTYSFSGLFERIDNADGNGDGSTVGILGGGWSSVGTLANSRAGALSTYQFTFSNTLQLSAGETVDFFQNANGNVYNDGTGFELSISQSAVPEMASWAMMLGGFGMIGGALRGRRKAAVSFG